MPWVFDLLFRTYSTFSNQRNLEILIVSTTTDKFVNKGLETYFNEAGTLSSIKFIDFIVPSDFEDARKSLK